MSRETNPKSRRDPPNFPQHSLSDEASRARRNLMFIVAAWILVIPAGATPTHIQWLGIEFANAAVSVQAIVSVLVFYFWLSYCAYARREWVQWWHLCSNELWERRNAIWYRKYYLSQVKGELEKIPAGSPENVRVDIPWYDGSIKHGTLDNWRKNLPKQAEELKLDRSTRFSVASDIFARSIWDYWLPFSAIFLPLGYLIWTRL